ncbi:MAG: dihydrolipoyl dehydrogenase, partial [Roseicyclus sp.]
MTPEPLDVAIIGAGTAGLSARSEVAKVTDRYRVFDPGPLGTTCARNGCMPSKAFLQSAHDLHRRHAFDALGLRGAEALRADGATVLAEVRRLRDGFVQGVIDGMEAWRDTHLIEAAPRFDAEGVLTAGGRRFLPRATVVATGSRPFVPEGWRERLGRRLLTTDDLFELEELPERVAVIGLGPVGLELGQALARLGVEVTAFDPTPEIGGLTDTDLQARLKAALAPEMRIVEAKAEPEDRDGAAIGLRWEGGEIEVDRLLVAMGRRPNLDGLGLDRVGAAPGESGRPDLPDGRLNLPGTRIYFAGDIVAGPALLHEAADEGSIAGHFAARGEDARFRRRVALRMVFCEPQIALAGETGRAAEGGIVTGEAPFDDAGRARLQRRPGGLIRIEAEAASARLLGAAILGPEAEHLAHLLCHAIDRGDDLPALLRAPAYHPTHEEVLRR